MKMFRPKLFHSKVGIFELMLFVLIQLILVAIILNIGTDIQAHLGFVRDYIEGKVAQLPSNFLFYAIIFAFSFISTKTIFLLPLTAVILTASIFLKYYIVKQYLIKQSVANHNLKTFKRFSIIAAMLIFTFSLPVGIFLAPNFYLGYFPPNVWHNSTTIFTMPFALLLFIVSIRQLENFKSQRNFWILVLILINAFSKPSYLFVFLPVYIAFNVYYSGFSKKMFINMWPILVCGLAIIFQYYQIYHSSEFYQSKSMGDGVALYPLYFYREHLIMGVHPVIQMIIFFLGSFIFPIVYILRNPKSLYQSKTLQFAFWSLLPALLIFYLFIETGSRTTHANFIWQVVMCNFILFFACLAELMKLMEKNDFQYKKFLPEISAFSLHFVMGFLYFAKMIYTLSYH